MKTAAVGSMAAWDWTEVLRGEWTKALRGGWKEVLRGERTGNSRGGWTGNLRGARTGVLWGDWTENLRDTAEARRVEREQVRALRRRIRLNRAAARRERVRRRNEPPRLSVREEWINALTHGAGALLAVGCTALLLLKSDTPWKAAAALVYGGSMALMMLMSCVYHAMPAGSGAKRVCRRFDYTSIYLLIGGTFAPLLLVYLGGRLGLRLFIAQWCVIAAGVALVLAFGPGHWRGLLYTLYFLLGWSGLGFVPEFYRNAPTLLWFIFMGGVVYTAGMIPFARHQKYDHCVWHFFVLIAAALHWAGIYSQIY